jgi:dTDP-4-dehydrorhamnose 3,5-epimerase
VPPFAEAKLIRCTRGALFDVLVDLRPTSETFLQWVGVELTPDNGTMTFIPKGFAHGFQSLKDDTEIHYQMSEFFSPGSARGFRWNDPLVKIDWPLEIAVISARDSTYADAHRENFSLPS